VSSDLLQAAAKKNEIRTRIRTLRIAFLLETSALPVAQKESANGARILYEKSNFKRAVALSQASLSTRYPLDFQGLSQRYFDNPGNVGII